MWRDRIQAGQELAKKLVTYKKSNTVVYGIPRGGVVVAAGVAKALNLPLSFIIARKIRAPVNPELALGAITADGQVVLDREVIKELMVSEDDLEQATKQALQEAHNKAALYGTSKEPSSTVIVVDDGIATGSTMQAAVSALRKQGAAKIIVAVPVVSSELVTLFSKKADEIVYLEAPTLFLGVSNFYIAFPQVDDNEVIRLLQRK
jgi:putative phosphoribosyl transferase